MSNKSFFDKDAAFWWDDQGPFKMLHKMNVHRKEFLVKNVVFKDDHPVLDIGCGGGLFTEVLSTLGYSKVVGIDESSPGIEVARLHAVDNNLDIDYKVISAERFLDKSFVKDDKYAVISCLELLEHVEDPCRIVSLAADKLVDGGYLLISTINRTLYGYWGGIFAAENLLGWVEQGTHEYDKFIKPSELISWARESNVHLHRLNGISYSSASQDFYLSDDVSLNYIALFKK